MFIENMDGFKGFIVSEPRERMILICPDCGIIEGVDKERWSAAAILDNDPPFCSACGTSMFPVQQENI